MNQRRRFLLNSGAVGLGVLGLAGCEIHNRLARKIFLQNQNAPIDAQSIAPAWDSATCVIPTEQVEGPFFLQAPIRQDITEDRIGIPLHIRLALVDAMTCQPITSAVVEIWHCDAAGRYSGYPEDSARDFGKSLKFTGIKGMLGEAHVAPINTKRYLRGAQISNADGVVDFVSIFPGWYEPRATHIHLKVVIDGKRQFDTQFYFDEVLANQIYATHPAYAPYGTCPYTVANDLALRNAQQIRAVVLKCQQTGHSLDDGLITSAKIAVR